MSSASSFDQCVSEIADEDLGATEQQSHVMHCLAQSVQDLSAGVDSFFLVYAASLVFFMQAGFAMLCAGSVKIKNVKNTMLKNLLDACGAAISFYSVGYAFAYGGSEYGGQKTFIGNANFFLIGVEDYVFWLFQFAFAATSATIVAGTLAERCQMAAYLCYSIMLSGFVYPVAAHAAWSYTGFLSPWAENPLWGVGMIDFSGSAIVHATGGVTALVAAHILGPRKGRFYDDSGNKLAVPKPFPGHSVALQVLGSFILWFGWYGFNSGSARSTTSAHQGNIAALAAVNTTLAAASGGITSLFTKFIIELRTSGEAVFNVNSSMNGCLAGLVSITAGCAVVEPWAALPIGFVAALLYMSSSHLLVKKCIDDAVDAIPVHMSNGIWGAISVGLFASPGRLQDVYGRSNHVGWFYSWGRGSGDFTLMGAQLVGVLFVVAWATFVMTPFFYLLNYLGWFRADPLEEIVGLDISYHGRSSLNYLHRDDSKLGTDVMEAYEKRKKERAEQTRNSFVGRHLIRSESHAVSDVGETNSENASLGKA